MFNPKDITVLILVGGEGTRLKEKVNDRPKPMALIHGKPMLEYQLDFLSKYNLRNVILCTGYKSEFIEERYQSGYKDFNIIISKEKSPLGTCGAIKNDLDKVNNQHILAINGDSYIEFDPIFFMHHLESYEETKILMLVKNMQDCDSFGSVTLDTNNLLIEFAEKEHSDSSGIVNLGFYGFNKDVFSDIPLGERLSLEEDFFPSKTGKILCVFSENEFIDIGTPETYKLAENFFSP